MDDFLVKPIDPEHTFATLQRWLNQVVYYSPKVGESPAFLDQPVAPQIDSTPESVRDPSIQTQFGPIGQSGFFDLGMTST